MRLEVEPEVRSAGILSFAVLVQNVCNNSCTKELLDRYTKYFLDKFSGEYYFIKLTFNGYLTIFSFSREL